MHKLQAASLTSGTPPSLASFASSCGVMSGHSQGVVIAAAVSGARTEGELHARLVESVGFLFFVGLRAQLVSEQVVGADPRTRSLRKEAVRLMRMRRREAGESEDGAPPGGEEPTPMLAIVGLGPDTVQRLVKRVGRALAAQREAEGDASARDAGRESLALSLVNAADICIVTGAAAALAALRSTLAKSGAAPGEDQARVPHSRRRPQVRSVYVPVSVPFHNPDLASACDVVIADCERFAPGPLDWTCAQHAAPVLDTCTAEPLAEPEGAGPGWLAARLVRLMCVERADWPRCVEGARRVLDATSDSGTSADGDGSGVTVLSFGPGGASGVALFTARALEGRGACVVVADDVPEAHLHIPGAIADEDDEAAASGATAPPMSPTVLLAVRSPVGCAVVPMFGPFGASTHATPAPATAPAATLFRALPAAATADWGAKFAPRIVQRACDGRRFVHTRMTALLGRPPIVVAGMTPTTSYFGHRLVAACANAGFAAELAGGGLPRPRVFRERVARLQSLLEPGAAIGINLLFLNQRQWAFQFPLLLELRRQGVPFESLTVAAGVPSVGKGVEIVSALQSAGLRYVAFKPGSLDAIHRVIAIAEAVPDFPVMVQWTGGRAGGHHSFEDMHEPILQSYGRIRACENVVLVAGSGFGDSAGALPYLTGEWSARPPYNRAAMPFDGVLLASRMMIAREAATAPEVKDLLVATPGVAADEQEQWEASYEADAGGVITVKSELGEPIHKVGNRGMRLWRQLDNEFFSLPPAERTAAVAKRRQWIVERLNEDFQKQYFGRKASGAVCGVEHMTYAEVLRRFLLLTFVTPDLEHPDPAFRHENFTPHGRWLDRTYRSRLLALMRRALERLGAASPEAMAQAERAVTGRLGELDVDRDPSELLAAFCSLSPRCEAQLMHGEDVAFFLQLCRIGGKPVPFVPVVDGDLEFWFKKDSLWYSEDLAAVRNRDAGRVCVLQGPVAVRHCTRANEPAADILNGVHDGIVAGLTSAGVVVVEGVPTLAACDHPSGGLPHLGGRGEEAAAPAPDASLPSWARALVSSPYAVRGCRWVASALPGLFTERPGVRRHLVSCADGEEGEVEEVRMVSSRDGSVMLRARPTAGGAAAGALPGAVAVQVVLEDLPPPTAEIPVPALSPLTLQFVYRADMAWAPVHEQESAGLLDEVRSFYARIWDCDAPAEAPAAVDAAAVVKTDGDAAVDGSWAWPLRISTGCEHTVTREDIEAYCASANLPVLMMATPSQARRGSELVAASAAAGASVAGQGEGPGKDGSGSVTATTAVAQDSRASAPLGLSIVAAWRALIAPLLAPSIGGNLLELVHLSHGHEVVESLASRRSPVLEGETVRSQLRVAEVRNDRTGKVVTCEGLLQRHAAGGWRPWLRLRSRFLFRGTFSDHAGTFSSKEHVFDLVVGDEPTRRVLASKPWFRARAGTADDEALAAAATTASPSAVPLMPAEGSLLRARFRTVIEFGAAGTPCRVRVLGRVNEVLTTEPPEVSALGGSRPFEQLGADDGAAFADARQWEIDFEECCPASGSAQDSVSAFFERFGTRTSAEQPLQEGRTATLLAEPDVSRAPDTNLPYASASRDLNPIHRNELVASLAGLPGTITHGMWSSANAQRVLEACLGGPGESALVRSFDASFEGMVLPGDELITQVSHRAMRAGRRVLTIETVKACDGQTVLKATAEVDQQPSAFVFTGQGSASVGMGMALFASSPHAKAVWEVADAQLRQTYGFSILRIVQSNPESLTIHFGGRRGAAIRRNFQSLTYEAPGGATLPLLPEITDETDQHTFTHPEGLLFATQFTQPALVITEKAAFEDMRAQGVLPRGFLLAGHSLGEYAALSAAVPLLRTEDLVELVFLRGLVMQNAVPRDTLGRSDFAMMACNPQRVASGFGEAHLQRLVAGIEAATGKLLQIVNNNVEDWQYVCTGDRTALRALSLACDAIHADPSAALASPEGVVVAAAKQARTEEARAEAEGEKTPLERGRATIPLPGIDVPFHSRFLLGGVPSFRAVLAKAITIEGTKRVLGTLLHRYVPNLVAMPFELSPRFVAVVYAATESEMLREAAEAVVSCDVAMWEAATADRIRLARTLLLELMAFQFASPVQWINTQRFFFTLPPDNKETGEGTLGTMTAAELAGAAALAAVVRAAGAGAVQSSKAKSAVVKAILERATSPEQSGALIRRMAPSRFSSRLHGSASEAGVRSVVEVGPVATLARMAQRTLISGRYGSAGSRQVRFYGRDEDRNELYFEGEDAGPSAKEHSEARRAQKAEEEEAAQAAAQAASFAATAAPVSQAMARVPAVTSVALPRAPGPAGGGTAPGYGSSTAGPAGGAVQSHAPASAAAASVPDAPLSHLLALRTLVAVRAGIGLPDVPATRSLKEVCAGKSAMQNEILGEVEKEFAGAGSALEGAEEAPLVDVAARLAGALPAYGTSGGGAALGPMVNKMGSAKLPGGFGLSAARSYIRGSWGLGEGRTEAVLVRALAVAPTKRLADVGAANCWLDECVLGYGSDEGLALAKGGGGRAGGAAGGGAGGLAELLASVGPGAADALVNMLAHGGGAGAGATKAPKGALARLAEDSREAWGHYLRGGQPEEGEAQVRRERELREEAETRLAAIEAEHGSPYEEGVRSVFTATRVRSFRSYWNWAATDLIEALNAAHKAPEGSSDGVGIALAESLANRCTSQLVRIADAAASLGIPAAATVAPLLRARHMQQPVFRPSFRPTRPSIEVQATGRPVAKEVPRECETCVADYAAAVGRPASAASDSAPMINVRTLSDEDSTRLEVNDRATEALLGSLRRAAVEGITFQGKTALVTGCGRGSIGAQIVAALLRGGARVVATTSRLNRQSSRAFQSLYEEHGARGATLTVVPFNQASRVDVDALMSHVYGPLGLDLDFVLPFAAINEAGRTLSTLDDKSELAHRIMLTNTLRLLGAVVEAKRSRGIVTRPAFAVLPLSPNHGVFGGDGLYAESKLGLESLMRKWSAEGWDSYLSIAGASIGWTRGTGLMSENDLVAAGVEERGCRTFSQAEMALNIVAMMAPPLVRIAGEAPVWADLRGGMHTLRDLKASVDAIRNGIHIQAAVAKAIALDAHLDAPATPGSTGTSSGAGAVEAVLRRSNWTGTSFPPLPAPAPAGVSPLPVGMVDLDRTVVVVGFGELGPWGSSRTRWEMECFGQLSLEGVIELAWLTGKIRFHNGALGPQAASEASWAVSEAERRAYIGWLDASSGAPVRDWEVKARYENEVLEHSGVRVIEPELFDGYDPHKKRLLRQVAMGRDLPWVEISSPAEAEEYREEAGAERVQVRQRPEDGAWEMRLLAGASISVARALQFDRWVAGQIPTGWDPKRCGVPADLASRIDRVTLFALVSAAEALIGSGLTDPYELYSYCHVSEVGSTVGGGMGGMRSIRQVFRDRFMEGDMASDSLQETFINTTAAWINMLLLSSAGPIKTVVGACATAAESVDVAVDTIQAGRAKVVLCGGTDDFGEEGSFEFASMGATSSATTETSMAREPSEMSRPMATSRGGFMESQGAGIQVLMQARLALALGSPIHAIIALTSTATDKEGRSVPAPGQGILTTAREAPLPGAPAAASLRRTQAAGQQSRSSAPPPRAAEAAPSSDGGSADEDDGRSVASSLREEEEEEEEDRGRDFRAHERDRAHSSADTDESSLLKRIATAGDDEEAVAAAWTELTELRLARHHPHLGLRYRRQRLEEDLRLAASREAEAAMALDEEEARVRGSAAAAAAAASSFKASPHAVLVSITARRAAMREEARSAVSAAMRRWCVDVCSGSPHVSPLRAGLARWGLTADDIAVASFHGTGTKANDANESAVTNSQLEALGRTQGKPVLVVAQKGLTGHPKGAAAAWMLNGLLQCMAGGQVPGTRNLDDVEPKLRAFQHLAFPNRTITLRSTRPGMPAVPAALMKSFGFGQAGAEILLVHPDLLLRALPKSELDAYAQRRGQREAAAYRYHQDVLLDRQPLIAVKDAPPFAEEDEKATYLDAMARATQDPVTREWQIRPGEAARQASEAGLLGAVHGKAWVGPISASEALGWLGVGAAAQSTTQAGARSMQTAESTDATAPDTASGAELETFAVPKSLLVRRSESAGGSAATMAAAVGQRLEIGARALPTGTKTFIGVDVEPVTTLAAAPESMLRRNFTAAERALCSGRPDPVASLAGRWAAKEAVFKALSACPGGPKSKGAGAALAEVEVLGGGNTAPKVSLHGGLEAAAKAARVTSVHVSISHAAGIAVAQAVVTTA